MKKQNVQNTEENKKFTELNKHLGVVISLLLKMIPKEGGLSLREQIKLLANLGIRPKEIAEILGRSPNYVNKELTTIRREKKKVYEAE